MNTGKMRKNGFFRLLSRILPAFLVMAYGHCGAGGEGDGSSGGTSFGDTVSELNDQEDEVNATTFSFAQAYEGFFGADLDSLTADEVRSAVDDFTSSGDDFVDAAETYSDLLESYQGDVSASLSALETKFQSAGVDTLTSDVGGVIRDTKTGEENCRAEHDPETDPSGYKTCIDQLRQTQLTNVANIGVGAVVSSGAGAIAGLAAGAAGAPVLVVVGATVGVGLVVGLVWTWCTSSSSSLSDDILAVSSGDTCNFTSCQGTVRELSDGRKAVICSVPPGTGTLTIHPSGGVPIAQDVTIDSSGVTVDISDCDADEESATAEDAEDCNSSTEEETGAEAEGSSCSEVATISANNSPADPSPGEDVTVTATVFPTVSGCTVDFGISGTDGYSNSDSPTTDSGGSASFTIPGGAEGVVDTVTIESSSVSTTIVYTF
ncbi:MAG: hypothetical protein HYU99_11945 [Deltaproteobacteria bacterium]|nr:hypothetical protein [Deltaproteobacteria bacterium]